MIAWARADGQRYGVDPDFIVLAGSSAGAHLTMMAALTANDSTFQPGFESVDTSITAGIGLGGYYGPLGGDEGPPSTPSAYLRADAPALLLIHGDHDSVVPFDEGQHLFALANDPKQFVHMPGSDHATLVRDGGYDHIWPFLAAHPSGAADGQSR